MGMQIDWFNSIVEITAPTTLVDAQTLHDFIEDQMATPVGLTHSAILQPEGKIEDPTNPGVYSQIILVFNSPWQIQFWAGSGYTKIYGAKIVGGLNDQPMKATGTAGDITVLESPVDGVTVGSNLTAESLWDVKSAELSIMNGTVICSDALASPDTSLPQGTGLNPFTEFSTAWSCAFANKLKIISYVGGSQQTFPARGGGYSSMFYLLDATIIGNGGGEWLEPKGIWSDSTTEFTLRTANIQGLNIWSEVASAHDIPGVDRSYLSSCWFGGWTAWSTFASCDLDELWCQDDVFLDCYGTAIVYGGTFTFTRFRGSVSIKSDPTRVYRQQPVGIVDLAGGTVTIDSSCDTGTNIIIKGSGTLIDNSAAGAVVIDERYLMDSEIEAGVSVKEALKVIVSALGGKVSGAGTTNVKFRDLNDSKDVIDATVDSNGNRSAVSLDTT